MGGWSGGKLKPSNLVAATESPRHQAHHQMRLLWPLRVAATAVPSTSSVEESSHVSPRASSSCALTIRSRVSLGIEVLLNRHEHSRVSADRERARAHGGEGSRLEAVVLAPRTVAGFLDDEARLTLEAKQQSMT